MSPLFDDRWLVGTLTLLLLLTACGDDSSAADQDANVVDDLGTADVSFGPSDGGSPDTEEVVDAALRDVPFGGDVIDLGTDADSELDAGPDGGVPTCVYPPSEMWTGPTDEPEVAAPGFRASISDPTFSSTVTRITDGPYQHYSKTQPWNADGTMVYMANSSHQILSTDGYVVLDLPGAPTGERRWSTTDPNRMYYLEGTELRAYDPTTDESVLIHDFAAEDCEVVRLGPWEGNLSIDNNRVAVACRRGADLVAIVYQLDTAAVIGTRLFAGQWGDENIDWLSISQLGQYVVINWRGTTGMRSYNATGELALVQELSTSGEHGDICVDADGNEVYVQVICGGHPDRGAAGVMSYRLDTGEKTVLIPSDDFVCTGHISCRNFRRPGWAYVSSSFHHEVFAVALDGSQTVQHYAHTHQSGGFEIFGVPDPDGCAVMWGSDWSGGTAAYTAQRE